MAALLNSPEQQFCDGNGNPYSGGTLATFVVGTSTAKATWSDAAGTALNSNPIVLGLAGRALIFGDGAYRLVLHDASGNLIFDQPASTLVSSAMAPVILASDIPTARTLLGIVDTTSAIAAANAGIATEAAARIAGDASSWSQLVAVNTRLSLAIAAEVTRAEGVENTLWLNSVGTRIQAGFAATDGDGHHRVTFPAAYTTMLSCVATVTGNGPNAYTLTVSANNTGVDVWGAVYSQAGPQPAVGLGFSWMAVGT